MSSSITSYLPSLNARRSAERRSCSPRTRASSLRSARLSAVAARDGDREGAKPARGASRRRDRRPVCLSPPRLALLSSGRAYSAGFRADLVEAEQPRDHHALHFVRALADLEDLLVAEEPRDRRLLHEPVAPVDLQRCVRGPVREQSRVELRHRRLARERASLVLQPRRLVDERAARLDLGRHVGERELHRLELRDRLAELLALLRVRVREVVRALREPDAHRRHRDAAAVEDLEELLEAITARPEQIPLGHGDVLERELARVGGAPAELLHRRRSRSRGCRSGRRCSRSRRRRCSR